MSKKGRSFEVECPECHTKQKTYVWHSVNVAVSPELKEKLFNGEINVFNCAGCGEVRPLHVPLLYNDMQKKVLVWYFPLSDIEKEGFLDQFTEQGQWTSNIPDSRFPEYGRIHVVFELYEMLRYIVFRERLHEKWMERNEAGDSGTAEEGKPLWSESDQEAAAELMEGALHLFHAAKINPMLEGTVREAALIIHNAVENLACQPEGEA
jgi:hypothetical protein